ncbi:MAG: hypothetical protein OXU68_00705 [Bacteroidota bacterium]|nr:hypothetical protein [Bacteroidota bacterium]
MHTVTFYPLGNADCVKIDLAKGRSLLFDYANTRDPSDKADPRIDLAAQLKTELSKADRRHFDVVAFTHLDDDHIKGAPDFFHLEHALKYQGSRRIKIKELWVPAAAITETGLTGDKGIIQREARNRLSKGKGIRVFSRPALLEKWLRTQKLTVDSRRHLITDAGQIIPSFTRANHGVEFFVHSPFAMRSEGQIVDRNRDALVVQAIFDCYGTETKLILASDVDHEAIDDIVRVTQRNNNHKRLEWDLFKIPHHCSYLSLGPEKGRLKTNPTLFVNWLFETQGRERGRLISTSEPIPKQDTDQPPHLQAANYYRQTATNKAGEFLVTMGHPQRCAPKPLVVQISESGATVHKIIGSGATDLVTHASPRAG